MAVSEAYVHKMRRAIRVELNNEVYLEIVDLVEECRHDLIQLGVCEEKANDEADSIIRGAVRSYVRWKFGPNNPEADRLRDEYMTLRDELRRRGDCCISPSE